ncbi:MAG: peptidylprolyl isomerase [Prolixibacteraceae bacterium]|jgi:peptidyl-prolyl cis-trans isomerase D|nr:peptidylprolyl isomerase [Prolixibacteraceae bacterium]MBT6999016.1 peptidylprolyl isomerase [Prolixibacteraceae bacterium]MBT7394485.1 peptidylprolyl isomerase [Prolixibacteraceae bacterium]
MATLQKIRTKAGLLVAIVIGISLAAFILGDMLNSGSSLFQKNQLEVGEIDGESIQYPDFQKKLEELGEIYKMNSPQTQLDENTWVQIREQTWQNMVRDIVMGSVYNNLGIEISSDELFDMLQGTNLHPIVQQLFTDQNTGMVDRGAVVRFLKNLETGVAPEQRDYWFYLEQQIVDERVQTKYNNMVGKGLYVTSEEAQNSLTSKNNQISFDYISVSHNTVADSLVVISEKDLKDYYNANENIYTQEKIRRIEFITYNVRPSVQDFEEAEHWITDIKAEFETATDNIQFVNSNSDVSFENTWSKKEDLPENIGAWVFDEGAEINTVFGYYLENEAYKLAKLHAVEMMPDSVQARHILLQVNTQEELVMQQTLADSLKAAIESGSDFATLALTFSTDQGSAIQGGDVGLFGRGQMVKPFEDAAFNNAINEITIVTSQFGIHIVQTTDLGSKTKQAQVAFMIRNVVPSTRTYQDTYALASKFAGENTSMDEFNAAVTEQKLNKRVASVVENERQIVGIENARILIRAAYESKEGEIILSQQGSPIFELGDNFVIAILAEATDEGIAPFDDVRERVELSVLKEKKAEYLVEKANSVLEGNTDLVVIASELGTTVQNATNINFNAFQIPGVGVEPAVIGTVSSLEVDQTSTPIAGNNGVFIVKVTSINQGIDQDITGEQTRLAQSLNFRATSQAFEAHRNSVEITDKRSKFY